MKLQTDLLWSLHQGAGINNFSLQQTQKIPTSKPSFNKLLHS